MTTEADPKSWTPDALAPYFETVLEAFGPARLMMGSDWPVCLVASSYAQWVKVVTGWIQKLSATEQEAILGGTAIKAYSL
jgi:L-fuconolactonase